MLAIFGGKDMFVPTEVDDGLERDEVGGAGTVGDCVVAETIDPSE